MQNWRLLDSIWHCTARHARQLDLCRTLETLKYGRNEGKRREIYIMIQYEPYGAKLLSALLRRGVHGQKNETMAMVVVHDRQLTFITCVYSSCLNEKLRPSTTDYQPTSIERREGWLAFPVVPTSTNLDVHLEAPLMSKSRRCLLRIAMTNLIYTEDNSKWKADQQHILLAKANAVSERAQLTSCRWPSFKSNENLPRIESSPSATSMNRIFAHGIYVVSFLYIVNALLPLLRSVQKGWLLKRILHSLLFIHIFIVYRSFRTRKNSSCIEQQAFLVFTNNNSTVGGWIWTILFKVFVKPLLCFILAHIWSNK